MRALWSGLISFGLINIPVNLYGATNERRLSFDMLHAKDLSPIRYARICRTDGKEIPWEEIVKGYEYQEGDYVVLTDEDFKKANLNKTKAIEILDFVNQNEIEEIFLEKPYYLEPEKNAEKAYALLREALKKSKKLGVAKFVLRNREHLAILKPKDDVIVLNQMRFKDEIRSTEDLRLPAKNLIKPDEIDMALKLINELAGPFESDKYHDTYTEELEEIIQKKAKGIKPKAKGKIPEATKVPDLMSVLKESLERHQRQNRA